MSIQFKTGVQYGFFFDQTRCHGCNICQVACKSWQLLPPGPGKMLRILQWEKGTFPNVRQKVLFAPCYQCENPICVEAAKGGLIKEPLYGAILVDPLKATSSDLKNAWMVCPYGAIAFDSDAPNSTAVCVTTTTFGCCRVALRSTANCWRMRSGKPANAARPRFRPTPSR